MFQPSKLEDATLVCDLSYFRNISCTPLALYRREPAWLSSRNGGCMKPQTSVCGLFFWRRPQVILSPRLGCFSFLVCDRTNDCDAFCQGFFDWMALMRQSLSFEYATTYPRSKIGPLDGLLWRSDCCLLLPTPRGRALTRRGILSGCGVLLVGLRTAFCAILAWRII